MSNDTSERLDRIETMLTELRNLVSSVIPPTGARAIQRTYSEYENYRLWAEAEKSGDRAAVARHVQRGGWIPTRRPGESSTLSVRGRRQNSKKEGP